MSAGALEAWLHRRWYGDEPPGLSLRALAGIYRIGMAATESRSVAQRVGATVIVVGNFTAGGTGKTPLVIALARHLAAAGRAPAILTRGYGRRNGHAVQVREDTPLADSGDEPRLLFERSGVPVFVDPDRVAAARAAINAGARLLLCDDGLQHRRLVRDIEIEVVDGARGYGNGLLLPAGPLRERPRGCDFRVVNGASSKGVARDGDWTMELQPDQIRSIGSGQPMRTLAEFRGTRVHAVAAIGNPGRFFAMLRQHGLEVEPHPFRDHHAFSAGDFATMRGPILMTSKDAVKCRTFGLAHAWEVQVQAKLPATFYDALVRRLDELDARP